jgi:hypothetical protein
LPTIVGAGFFLAGAVAMKLAIFRGAPPVSFEQPTSLSAWQAFGITRKAGARSRIAIWAWTFVALGLVAAALFWGRLINLDLFV